MTTKDVTQADVTAAEREAAADREKIETLKTRVMSGGDVSPDELAQAKQLAEWSELRVTAVRQQAEQSAERNRREACAALRPDIDQFADQVATQAVEKLKAITDAVVGYWRYMAEQEAERVELLKRVVALTDEWHAPHVPPDHNAGIGYRAQLLIAGRRRIDRIDAGRFMGRALALAARELKPEPLRFHLDYHGTIAVAPEEHNADPAADLARIVQPMSEPGEEWFVRGPGGAVFGADKPWTDEQVKQQRLTRISAKEAWGV